MPDVVGEDDGVEEGGGGGVEQLAVERGECEGLLEAGGEGEGAVVLGAAALGNEGEEAAEGGVEVGALMGGGGGEVDELEVAEGLEAVAAGVHVAFLDGDVAELGAGLDVEEEHQAVHHAEAFEAEGAGIDGVLAGVEALLAGAGLVAELADGLVAQDLDGLAEGVLEVLADAKGVLVGVFVEALEQAGAGVGGEGFAVEKGGGGLEGVGILAVEDLGPVEAQEAVVGPLVAVDEEPFLEPDEEDEAGRLLGPEEGLGHEFEPGRAEEEPGDFLASEVHGLEGVVERIVVLAAGLVGGDDEEARAVVDVAPDGPCRDGHVGLEREEGGLEGMAEGGEERAMEVLVGAEAFVRVAEAFEGGEGGEPLAGESGEPAVGGTGGGAFGVGDGGVLGGLPALDLGADVALEDLGEVMVAVELVLVGDPGEALDGWSDRHGGRASGLGFSGRRRRGPGGRGGARWSWCPAPIGGIHRRRGGCAGSVARGGCA